jgi:hypothetical protein
VLAAGQAGAERSGRGGVVAYFNGSTSPDRLPRRRPVPVSITLSGSIHSSDGTPLPKLSQIEFAFGSRGGLDTTGLARCPQSKLRNATQREALARCSAALIGRGTILTEVRLAPTRPLLAHASALAFNARSAGRPAVLVHAYSASPPVSFVLPFYLRTVRSGAYGVLLRSPVARTLGRWPRLRSFRITFTRRFRSDGVRRSYLNARCPLPPRFNSLNIPLARATYSFTPAPTVSTTILRPCHVRE